MGKLLGFLERDGLVSILPSPTDGRSRVIALTPEGQRVFRKAEPLWRNAQSEFARLNGTETVETLHRGLTEMTVG